MLTREVWAGGLILEEVAGFADTILPYIAIMVRFWLIAEA